MGVKAFPDVEFHLRREFFPDEVQQLPPDRHAFFGVFAAPFGLFIGGREYDGCTLKQGIAKRLEEAPPVYRLITVMDILR